MEIILLNVGWLPVAWPVYQLCWKLVSLLKTLVEDVYDDVLCAACKLSVGNHLLYLHMSSHYRRICNAKCTVDTSPPCAYKLNHSARRRRHHHTNCQSDVSSYSPVDCELGLARNIANDAKQSSHTYSWVFNCFIWNITVFYYSKVDFSPRIYGFVWYLKTGQDHHSLTWYNFSFDAVHSVLIYIEWGQ